MKKETFKHFGIIVLIICLSFVATCEFSKPALDEETSLTDTLFLSQWRHEKKEKLQVISDFENRIKSLEKSNDSLIHLASTRKKEISSQRLKTKVLQEQLKQVIEDVVFNADSADSLHPRLEGLFDSMVVSQSQADTACDETILVLETRLANRDSTLEFERGVSENLKALNRAEEVKNIYLSEKLTSSLKSEKKKSRQNKILKAAVLVLSGVTTSLLISQNLR
jgi:hypothetical protein